MIFTSGERVGPPSDAAGEQCIPCDVRTVHELLLESDGEGRLKRHSSRGDVDAAHVCGYHTSIVAQAAAVHESPATAVGRAGAATDAAKATLGFGATEVLPVSPPVARRRRPHPWASAHRARQGSVVA